MTDREKVIKESEEAIDILAKAEEPAFWMNFVRCAFENALALLKEQEAVEPDVDSEGTCSCGNCGETVGWYPIGSKTPVKFGNFCPECGRKVKWE